MAAAALVDVVGLKALQRDLRKMSDPRAGDLAKALAQAGKQAMQPIADTVRSAYPNASGRLAGSVRVTGSRTGAAVRVGRKTVPYAGPVDFGGWPAGRPYISTGRYLYPTAQSMVGDTVAKYEQAVAQVVDTFRWSNTTTSPAAVHD